MVDEYRTSARAAGWPRIAAAGMAGLIAAALPAGAAAQQVDPYTPYGSPVGQQQSSQPSRSANDRAAPAAQGDPAVYQTQIQPAQIGGSSAQSSTATTPQPDSTFDRNGLLLANPGLKPPAKPGEFETYVRDRLGRALPRFGADLLAPAARDFALPATATVPPDYVLNVGDVVTISLTGSVEGSVDRQIGTDGTIFLDKVGAIRVAGVRYGDLRDVIATAVGRQYRGYTVTVLAGRLHGIRVYVTGFANNPGAFSVGGLSTMLNAVFAAGGPNAGGSFRSVQLIRRGEVVRDLDLYAILRGGDRSLDAVLQNEDVLFIPPVGHQVAVFGSVNDEAIYELKPGETLSAVLRYAGGPNALADPSRLMLYRLSDADTIGVRQVPVGEAASLAAVGGDIVQILSKGTLVSPLERQSALVRIEGEIEHPGNYYVPANTTLAEVVSRAGGLTSRAFVFGSRIERQSVRAQQRQSYREALQQLEVMLASAPLTGSGIGSDAATQQAQLAAAREVIERLRAAEPDGRLVVDQPLEASTLPGDLVVENNDRIVVPPRPVTVGVFGAVYRPASFLMEGAPLRVRDYVEKAGGAIRSADRGQIFVVRANGAVLSHRRGALAARVYPGDVIFVPVKARNASFWAKLRDITTVLFQFGLSAATVAAINN